jgi:MscS family membrane protein
MQRYRNLCAIVAIALASAGLFAQEQPGTAAAAIDPLGRSTPRGTMMHFLRLTHGRNYAAAAEYLEISRRPGDPADTVAQQLAEKLQAVLDRELIINLTAISDEPEGKLDDGLPRDQEIISTLAARDSSVDLKLHRVRIQGGVEVWLFSSETLRRIPAVYAKLTPSWLEAYVPDRLTYTQWLGVAVWRWMALLLLVPLAYGVSFLIALILLSLASPIYRRTPTAVDDRLVEMLKGPLRLFLAVCLFHYGMISLALPLLLRQLLGQLELVAATAAVAWFLLRLTDMAAERANRVLVHMQRAGATSMVPLGRRIVKALVLSVAVLAVLDNAGFDLRAILTGLGVGGIAVALAAQKTLENVFGGVSIVLDQPVRVGDFCKFGDSMGTVEDIGLRSTRIRTLDRTIIAVPNSQFAAVNIENFARREKVWFHPVLALRLDTRPDQLRFVLAELRKLLYSYPKLEPGARIRLIGFGASSLNLEIFAYVPTADYDEFLAIQEDLLLRMMEIIEQAGTSLALPAQTNYFARDRGIDAEKTNSALATVGGWKANRALPFPDYPKEDISRMKNQVPYPPPESMLANGKS